MKKLLITGGTGFLGKDLPKEYEINRFTVKFLDSDTNLDVSKITEKLEFKPEYSLERTIKETTDWYKSLKRVPIIFSFLFLLTKIWTLYPRLGLSQ